MVTAIAGKTLLLSTQLHCATNLLVLSYTSSRVVVNHMIVEIYLDVKDLCLEECEVVIRAVEIDDEIEVRSF